MAISNKSAKDGTCNGTAIPEENKAGSQHVATDEARSGSVLNGCAQESTPEHREGQGAQAFSVRAASFDIIGGLVFLTFGVFVIGFPSAETIEKFADGIEGWLIGRSRKEPSGAPVLGLTLHGFGGQLIVLINEPEGSCIVEELHGALGALERLGEGDPREDGDERDPDDPDDRDDGADADELGTRFVSVPPPRDTEPHPAPALPPDELELGRGAGGLLTLAEVCS